MYALRKWSASLTIALLGVALLTIALLGVGWLSAPDKNEPRPKDLATAKAVVRDLQPKIVERGSLESCNNNDVKCEVKCGNRGCEKIKWVVDNGSQVKKGDLIFEIDDSRLREKAAAAKITLDAARAEVVAAGSLLKLKTEVDEVKAAETGLQVKRAILAQQEALYKELIEQIGKCKIKAPATGVVVYHVPERWGGSLSMSSILDPGEPVQFGQKLLSIPDLSRMRVNVRIHEAFINSLKVGLKAKVWVEGLRNRELNAHVTYIDSIARPQDWMSPDVMLYQAYVEIDDSVKDLQLKPGNSAVCEIFPEPLAERVLAVPIRAILMTGKRDIVRREKASIFSGCNSHPARGRSSR